MSQENHGRLAIMSFKGGCDLGQLSLSVSPCCLFVRRQCCRKLEAAKSNNFFKLCHATLIALPTDLFLRMRTSLALTLSSQFRTKEKQGNYPPKNKNKKQNSHPAGLI
jgi:hypothetical protein